MERRGGNNFDSFLLRYLAVKSCPSNEGGETAVQKVLAVK